MNLKIFRFLLFLSLSFLFVISIVSATCTYTSLSVSKPQILTDDNDAQQATLTIQCATPQELAGINEIRLMINKNSPRGYLRWTSAGFVELAGYGSASIEPVKSLSQKIDSNETNTTSVTFAWTISPTQGAYTTNPLSYYWHESSGRTVALTETNTSFQTVLAPSLYSSFNSLTLAKQDLVSTGQDQQSAVFVLNKGELSNIQGMSFLVNFKNTPTKPFRGYFQWTPTKGFKEYSSYGNQYVELLANESSVTIQPNQYIFNFTWRILDTYGSIPSNDLTYSWTEVGGKVLGPFTDPQSFSVNPTLALTPSEPLFLNGSVFDQKVKLFWTTPTTQGGSPIRDYQIEYSRDGAEFTVYNDPVSTLKTANITGLDNDVPYQFRVRAVNSIGAGPASETITLTPKKIYFNHILVTGQSLALGAQGVPALTTTQPYNNKMLWYYPTYPHLPLIPLKESTTESIDSAMGNFITGSTPNKDYNMIVTRSALGGSKYTVIKKGTQTYQNSLSEVKNASWGVSDLEQHYRFLAIAVLHGEDDRFNPDYEANLVEWQHDYETDINTITGQNETIPFFIDQISSFSKGGMPPSPRAQLEAAKHNPGKIYLVGPNYFLTYKDTVHLINVSYRQLGEYYGKVMTKVLLNHEDWKPLMPETITREGKIITAKFHVPSPPLVFDTALVLYQTNYGFTYNDTGGRKINITKVEIISPDTVQVTLDQIPNGTNQRFQYAYRAANVLPGAFISTSARGNLRDSDNTPSQYGNPLYNWAVHFDEPITTVAPAAFDFNLDVNQSSETITEEQPSIVTTFLTLLSGITQNIVLSFSGCPSGASCSFSSPLGIPNFTSLFRVEPNPTIPPGTYQINLTASNENISKSATYTLTVEETQAPFDFDLTLNQSSDTISLEQNVASVDVSANLLSGTSEQVTLNTEGCPGDCTFIPSASNPDFTSTLTVANINQAGDYTINITATNANLSRSQLYTLTVSE